ncbi:PREDICTED: putative gamma-glutamyltransferase YwrD, partial [Papilio polytes]|uniref:putative gamma-glutamyltransferase YwrD n=1 Tax=Papilio polytes TaxID=76194 RepID=UPI000675D97F
VPKVGERFCQKTLAATLKELSLNGLNSFYKGKLAKLIAQDMSDMGMPITESDLANYAPVRRSPLLDRLRVDGRNEAQFIHNVVEATKQAFVLRDRYITDPSCMKVDPQSLLAGHAITEMAHRIRADRASNEGKGKGPGDTIWLGVMDDRGFSVSFIQSIYFNFGSGVVLPRTGILWHNRGVAFSSQTQAAIFHRYVVQGYGLQKSISAPRWIYGSTNGDRNDVLHLEDRFSTEVVDDLKEKGHEICLLPSFSEMVGQAGALVRHPNGILEGAFDPRSDGSAAGF